MDRNSQAGRQARLNDTSRKASSNKQIGKQADKTRATLGIQEVGLKLLVP